MVELRQVVEAAERLNEKDEAALEVLLGMRERAIEKNPALRDDLSLEIQYSPEMGMGTLDELKAVGRRIAKRWSKELHTIICGTDMSADRTKLIEALNLGEAAVIATVAGALIGLQVPAPLVAAAAPLIVKRFIWPARDELCKLWAENLEIA